MLKLTTKDGDFRLPPEELLVATLHQFDDLGVQPDPFNPGKTRHQVHLIWDIQLPDGTLTPQHVWVRATLHSKATLRKIVKALNGGVDVQGEVVIDSFIGCKCRVEIEHYDSKGQKRSRIVRYLPLKSAGAPAKVTPTHHDAKTEDLPEFLR
jgi:hypothetical protein